jgi:hypothetical protein
MAKKTVLAIGIDPALVDFTALPQFTPEMFRRYIDAQIERMRGMGYEVTSCLIDLGDTAEAVTAEAIHRLAPKASICFNTTSADTAEAVQR